MENHLTTEEDFERFKSKCIQYYDMFGLNEYRLDFRHDYMKDAYASINVDNEYAVAVITLNKKNRKDDTRQTLEDTASHEMIHLLLARYSHLAKGRSSDEELDAEEERVCHRIESILKRGGL